MFTIYAKNYKTKHANVVSLLPGLKHKANSQINHVVTVYELRTPVVLASFCCTDPLKVTGGVKQNFIVIIIMFFLTIQCNET